MEGMLGIVWNDSSTFFIVFMIYSWQQTQWQKISQLLKTGRLPHAMLLHGNQGLAKADFAVTLANAVLCQQPAADSQACGVCKACQLLAANTHPDLTFLKPTAPPTSKSKNPVLSIRIDDIRALCEKLNQTSQYGGFRVAILNQAELLTLSAANSLLKTLEEPGENVLILLVTARTHRLPVTIRSRCQLLRFTMPDESQSLHWLKGNQQPGFSDSQLQQALKYACGSPLAALDYLHETEHQEVLSEAMTASVSGKNSLDYAAKLVKFARIRTLESMMSWAADLSKLQLCGAETAITNEQYRNKLQVLAKRVNQQRLYRFYDQLNFNISHSSIAVNEQLLWESLLLSWDKL
jgi:DNA polymerase-3 subunit delta'